MKSENHGGIITTNIYDGQIYERLSPLVEKVADLLFRRINFNDESIRTLQEYTSRDGYIVYASFHSSNISLLILYNLLRRHGFQPPVFALEYNPFLLQEFDFVRKRLVKFIQRKVLRRHYSDILDTDYVRDLLAARKSIILSLISKKYFVRRYTEIKYDSLLYLIEVQKKSETPIYLMPQMIFWNRNPERTAKGEIWASARDLLTAKATGDKGLIAGWIGTLTSVTPAFVRVAAPINLKEEIENSRSGDSRQTAIEVRNKLLGVYHHEKRTTLGPVIKSRQELMERVLYHRNVLEAISTVSREENISENVLRGQAVKFFREIAADFSVVYLYLFKRSIDYVFSRVYDGISYDPGAIKEIREAAQKGPLVFTPCHKSHMDYLIISHLLFHNNMFPPHIAAGVNLSFFPLGVLFRHSGAFFMRRTFRGQPLYSVVFRQYVKTLVSEGYSIEFFIEGGRTRTGKLVYPKLGFLSFLVEAIEEGYHRDMMFVPIAINYDRIFEEKTYAKELKGKEKEGESMSSLVESRKFLKRKWGRAYVTFNKPFSIHDVIGTGIDKQQVPAELARTIVRRISGVTVVNPFALTSTAMLLTSVKGFSRDGLAKIMKELHSFLIFSGVNLSDSLKGTPDFDDIIETVIATYRQDRIIEDLRLEGSSKKEVLEGYYVLREDNRARILFYKNSIIHYFLPLSFASLALLATWKRGDLGDDAVRSEYNNIKDFFSEEYVYDLRDEARALPFPDVVYSFFGEKACIKREGGRIVFDESRSDELCLYARLIRDHFESYMIVSSSILGQSARRLNRRDVVVDIRKNGVRMYHMGDVRLSESLSLPTYQNAIRKYIDMGVLSERHVGAKQAEIAIVEKEKATAVNDRLKSYLEIIG